jgi:hypothetical protein
MIWSGACGGHDSRQTSAASERISQLISPPSND